MDRGFTLRENKPNHTQSQQSRKTRARAAVRIRHSSLAARDSVVEEVGDLHSIVG